MIAKEFGIAHLSAGELLRREQNSGSENGKLIDSFLRDGKIVPVALSLALLKQEILGREEQRYLIDGFPRNHDNLQGWLAAMPEACELEAVVCVTCPEEVLERRILQRGLTSNRTDDNLETLRKRFATYRRDSLPVIDWFRRAAGSGNFSFLHIDGDLPREAVYRQIRQQLLPVLRTELAQLAERFFRLLGQGRGPQLAAFLVRPDGCELSPAAVERVAAEESALFRRVGGRPWTSIEVAVDGRDARSVSEWAEQVSSLSSLLFLGGVISPSFLFLCSFVLGGALREALEISARSLAVGGRRTASGGRRIARGAVRCRGERAGGVDVTANPFVISPWGRWWPWAATAVGSKKATGPAGPRPAAASGRERPGGCRRTARSRPAAGSRSVVGESERGQRAGRTGGGQRAGDLREFATDCGATARCGRNRCARTLSRTRRPR